MSATPRSTPSSSRALITSTSSEQESQLSLNKQLVLEEDEYTAALSKIIARDFFPSLAHLDATNSYLSALDSQDQERIEQSVRRLVDLRTPTAHGSWAQKTPHAQGPSDTPLGTPRGGDEPGPSKRRRIDMSLSLDAFQAKYTSEDNASFTEILDEENKKRKEMLWWAWDAEKKVNDCKMKELEGRERLLLTNSVAPSTIQRRIEGKEMKAIENGKVSEVSAAGEDNDSSSGPLVVYPNTEQLKEEDEVQEPVDVMAPRKDTRSAGVPGWRFRVCRFLTFIGVKYSMDILHPQARNSLMFSPDADSSPYCPPPPSDPSTSNDPPKEVRYANTRLPEQSEEPTSTSSSVPPSPTRSRIGAAIMGTPYHKKGDETPKVQGFGFVSALPSPSPSQMGPEAMKELMTWGSLLGTPRVIHSGDDLDPSSSAPSPFKVPELSKRDDLGRRLGVRASKSLRERAALLSTPSSTPRKRKGVGDMPPPASTPRRVAQTDMLSPAARNLLGRTKGGLGLGISATPVRSDAGPSQSRPGAKQLDLRNVGWSPMSTPVSSNARRR